MRLSYSAVETWRRCQAQYNYRYVRRLRRRAGGSWGSSSTMGNVMHTYFAEYYGSLAKGIYDPDEAHLVAKLAVSVKHLPELDTLANAAFMAGEEALAAEYQAMVGHAESMMDRYFVARGKDDADQYEVLMVEGKMAAELVRGETMRGHELTGKLDMVTRSRLTGLTALWEHKCPKNPPSAGVRLRDYQTVIYAALYENEGGDPIQQVIWNYARTKPPTPLTVENRGILKNGTLSKDKRFDTTWPVYLAKIKELKLRESDYTDVRFRLERRELDVFFPRYDTVHVVDRDVLLRDLLRSGDEMEETTALWQQGEAEPVRNISRFCDQCEMLRLCEAALTGGDEDDLIGSYYEIQADNNEAEQQEEELAEIV